MVEWRQRLKAQHAAIPSRGGLGRYRPGQAAWRVQRAKKDPDAGTSSRAGPARRQRHTKSRSCPRLRDQQGDGVPVPAPSKAYPPPSCSSCRSFTKGPLSAFSTWAGAPRKRRVFAHLRPVRPQLSLPVSRRTPWCFAGRRTQADVPRRYDLSSKRDEGLPSKDAACGTRG